MVENENNVGVENANDGSTPETNNVKTEEAPINETAEATAAEVEKTEIIEIDPNEKIISDIFDSGETQVTTSTLISSGFDSSLIGSYVFSVGKFNLSRLLLVEPYKIEKRD